MESGFCPLSVAYTVYLQKYERKTDEKIIQKYRRRVL